MENTIENILKEYERIKAEYEKKQIKGEEFNVFHLINEIYGIGETKHSRFLAFILNPKEIHGQGNLFLKLFLEKLKFEFNENETWEVFAEKDNADILLKCTYPKKCIVIENKSNDAVDQSNQLYRYWFYHIRNNVEENELENSEKCRIIYLPKGDWKHYEEQSITKPHPEDYDWAKNESLPDKLKENIITKWTFLKEIRDWLNECTKEKIPYRIKCFIEDYIKFWDDTKLKDEFYMEKLENYFRDKEQNWMFFCESSNYIIPLQDKWLDSFIYNINSINEKLDKEWSFYNERDKYGINLKYNDLRWHLGNIENICFVFEFENGLTIWKRDFLNNKKHFQKKLEEIFGEYFEYDNSDSNYAMRLKDFEKNEDTSFITWNVGNNSTDILNSIKSILEKYTACDKVKQLFKEIDTFQAHQLL